jgi:2-amino-4-hydroxy-6-hydroxymethyldihydropteridine diphosphokinase
VLHAHKVGSPHALRADRPKDMSGKLVRVEHKAYVGLGANLGEREATIGRAVELLAATPGIEVAAVSTLRETDPVGYADQPRFLNGVAALETELTPRGLLDRLLAVEQELGRVRGEGPRFGPRTIDLDLLLYGDEVVDEPGLVVPHPRLTERRFVLEPLHELDPELTLPDGRRVADLLR